MDGAGLSAFLRFLGCPHSPHWVSKQWKPPLPHVFLTLGLGSRSCIMAERDLYCQAGKTLMTFWERLGTWECGWPKSGQKRQQESKKEKPIASSVPRRSPIQHTSSLPMNEVKQCWVQSLLGWVTAWEHWMLLTFFCLWCGQCDMAVDIRKSQLTITFFFNLSLSH